MANAIPVNTKPKKEAPKGPEVVVLGTESKHEDVLARAQEILAAEAPAAILDEQVNQIGQSSSYGKAQKIMEVAYPEKNDEGKLTGKMQSYLRIDH